jgi:hypothetical protein
MPSPHNVNGKYLSAWSIQIWRFSTSKAFFIHGSLSEIRVSAVWIFRIDVKVKKLSAVGDENMDRVHLSAAELGPL